MSANFDQAFKKISNNFFRAEFENPFKKANLNEDVWEMYRKNEQSLLKTENILKLNEYSNSENESVECKLNKNRRRKEKVTKI